MLQFVFVKPPELFTGDMLLKRESGRHFLTLHFMYVRINCKFFDVVFAEKPETIIFLHRIRRATYG